ncbi:MAG TPA: SoxR reducing system RseC family protein [Candidatus Competibacteraceae bacterium]|nr:SoxR reducing system RseC family protein [Candidatus Competibacteraceae bacterium]HPF58684.1 SoxR reducing system RseC family protein [Candidatus Competibacteraceae bacterium]HRY18607.1 SoxR reducing system RseC family protein [Candidatus Competibacteraceae bacterium]
MIEERARVAEAGDGYAWVEIERRSACGNCHASDGCGTAALANVWSGRQMRTRAISNLPLRSGDEVIVGLADGVLLRGALLAYLLPLVLMLAGALLGDAAFASAGEEPVILLGALGLGLGFLAVRVSSRSWQDDVRFQPVVLRRVIALESVEGLTS